MHDIEDLKNYLMGGVSIEDIAKKDKEWCAAKWLLIMGATHAGHFKNEVFDDPQTYYEHLLVALENRIHELG